MISRKYNKFSSIDTAIDSPSFRIKGLKQKLVLIVNQTNIFLVIRIWHQSYVIVHSPEGLQYISINRDLLTCILTHFEFFVLCRIITVHRTSSNWSLIMLESCDAQKMEMMSTITHHYHSTHLGLLSWRGQFKEISSTVVYSCWSSFRKFWRVLCTRVWSLSTVLRGRARM